MGELKWGPARNEFFPETGGSLGEGREGNLALALEKLGRFSEALSAVATAWQAADPQRSDAAKDLSRRSEANEDGTARQLVGARYPLPPMPPNRLSRIPRPQNVISSPQEITIGRRQTTNEIWGSGRVNRTIPSP